VRPRHLVVLGDQLDGSSAAFDGFDNGLDAILQMEVREEATYTSGDSPFSSPRCVTSATSSARSDDGSSTVRSTTTGTAVAFPPRSVAGRPALGPDRLIVLEPGDWRVRRQLETIDLPLEIRADRHFLCGHETFAGFAGEQPRLVLESFCRFMRRRLGC
jgi:deoxyribodipyrimidine photolyase-related protein